MLSPEVEKHMQSGCETMPLPRVGNTPASFHQTAQQSQLGA